MKNYQGIFAPFMERYILLKRGLGYKAVDMEYSFSIFDRFTIGENVSVVCITRELADKWAVPRPNEASRTRYVRIAHVAQLSAFLCSIGYESHIPKLPKLQISYTPYIFSKEQIAAIFEAVDRLGLKCSRHETCISAVPTLFRMLYGTGMRLGEALMLRDKDVDLQKKTIFIKGGKNGRDRRLPISDSLAEVCVVYRAYRDLHAYPGPSANTFFRTHSGTICSRRSAYRWFRRALLEAGIPHLGRGLGPRVHDVRHTHSTHALAAMVEKGLDLYYALPILSTSLGHRSLDATEQYVRLTSEVYPELLRDIDAVCSYAFPKKTTL